MTQINLPPANDDIYAVGFDKNLNRASNADLPSSDSSPSSYSGVFSDPAQGIGFSALATGSQASMAVLDPSKGLWLGATTFAAAPFAVNMNGELRATSGKFSGDITGATGTFTGTVSIGSLNIPDTTTANSFHVDSNGNTWWGANVATGSAGANAAILNTGAATFKSVALSTSVSISGIANNTSTDISLLEKTHTMTFTSASATQVNWTSGTVTLSNGRTFSISSGNTGSMSALTYIYVDPGVSSTVLQTTTVAATALGANKILIGCAQNNTVTASYVPYGPGQPLVDGANIGALSIVAGNIAASTITGTKIAANTITAGNITAGTITATEIASSTITGTNISSMNLTSKTITADTGTIAGWTLSTTDLSKTSGGNTVAISTGGTAFVAGPGGLPTAYITQAGAAVFKSIQVGGSSTQYSINDSGIFSFGDGSDGALTTSGDVALTSDKYYTNLTVATGNTFNPSGYRIFVSGTLTLSGTGKIARNGNSDATAGGNAGGSPGTGGGGATALADGYLKGSVAGAAGSVGKGATGRSVGGSPVQDNTDVTGGTGTSTSNSIGLTGTTGGVGGTPGTGSSNATAGGAGGPGGTATASNVKLIANWHLATLLDIGSSGTTIKYDNSAGCGGGGGGGGGGCGAAYNAGNNSGGAGGGGGGAGSNGGIVAIYARNIVIGASAAIQALGGNGANGGNAGSASVNGGGSGGGGGAGGAGGNGGQIILVYNTLSNSGSISVAGGTGGTGGTGGAGATGNGTGLSGQTGGTGPTGTSGTTRQFQLSL